MTHTNPTRNNMMQVLAMAANVALPAMISPTLKASNMSAQGNALWLK
jgi:hypothetical protein